MIMGNLMERTGMLLFIQLIIEGWNELVILMLIFTMIIDTCLDKATELTRQTKIPFTKDLLVFYSVVFVYNLSDIMYICFGSTNSGISYYTVRTGVFMYYASGGFLTVFFLHVLKKYIIEKNELKNLGNVISVFLIFQSFLYFLLMITPFTGALYRIDANNEYIRSWGYWVWQCVTLVTFMFIGAVVLVCMFRKAIDPFAGKIFSSVVVPSLSGLFLSIFTHIRSNNIMIIISSLILFMLYEKNKTEVTINKDRELQESRQELNQSKIRLLVAQIQPHFIYNSLMALQSKCIDNPVVYGGIKNFGEYLRYNFTAITDNEVIPFEEELKCIKAYLNLERLNFGDKMKLLYDIEIDRFMLPALCIEPLVENAVRYGIGTYEKGGTVWIIVRDEPDCIEIEVKDDGSGGNKLTDMQKKRKSIGLENVRLRLKASGMGTLSITQDETGTSAVVRLK